MTKHEKAIYLVDVLQRIYGDPEIPLNHKDSFTLLVAVALSAQTTDKKVNEVTHTFFERADSPEVMAEMEVSEIKECIKEIGLSNTKAKNLKAMSQLLLERHHGIVPNTFEELESLPGVGHKTASVLMSQAFGFPAFPVDTHIHRLMWRWGLSNGKSVEQTEKDAKRLFKKEHWNNLHLQIIYYGREYSPARAWDLEKDIITKTIGRKAVINEWYKSKSLVSKPKN